MLEFSVVSDYFEKISKTSSRLEITDLLFELFSLASSNEIKPLVYFCQGKLGPNYLPNKDTNIGPSILISLISQYTAIPESKIKEEFLRKGDLGLVIESNYQGNKQETLFSKDLTFLDVYEIFKKISVVDGKGSTEEKQKYFKYILFNSNKISAKYLVRFPISFRLGFSDSTIVDALAFFGKREKDDQEKLKYYKALITNKYQLISDLGLLAQMIFDKGLEELEHLKVTPFIPIKSQLAERSKDLSEIKERMGVFAVDTKVDGFRLQIHKIKDQVKIFSRQEEDITEMFPDIVENVLKINKDFIIDSEAIGYDSENKKYHSFQITITRKRKYDVLKKSEELPLHLKVFDILYFEGEDVYVLPFSERRKIVEEHFDVSEIITPTEMIITESVETLEEMFLSKLDEGFEGVICKDLNQPYRAGSRGYSWIKFKKSYQTNVDTIDAVIIGFDKGQGKRAELGLGALLVGLYDKDDDKYYTIAKVGTGLTDEVIKDLYSKLNEKKLSEKPDYIVSNISVDWFVVPEIVVEINYDEITNSPTHTFNYNEETEQGLALRFPRLVKIRTDRSPKETTTLEEIEKFK